MALNTRKNPADQEFKTLAEWAESPPAFETFGDRSGDTFRLWARTLADNLPPKVTMAIARLPQKEQSGGWSYELRGRCIGRDLYAFTAYSEMVPHEEEVHLGRADVHELYEGRGIGGALFGAQLAAAAEAGVELASFATTEKGTRTWAPYRVPLDWYSDTTLEFAENLGNVLRTDRRVSEDVREEFLGKLACRDDDILWEMMDHPDLQGRGRGSLALKLIEAAGEWAGVIHLHTVGLERVFDFVAERAAEGKQPFVKWRPDALVKRQRDHMLGIGTGAGK